MHLCVCELGLAARREDRPLALPRTRVNGWSRELEGGREGAENATSIPRPVVSGNRI
jgi:hypothetical protein